MFKENYNKLIQKKQITTYKVMKDTGIPKSVIYYWVTGERKPASEHLTKLADYLDCSTDYLLGRTDNPEVNR